MSDEVTIKFLKSELRDRDLRIQELQRNYADLQTLYHNCCDRVAKFMDQNAIKVAATVEDDPDDDFDDDGDDDFEDL